MGQPAIKGTNSYTRKSASSHQEALKRLAAVSGLTAAQDAVHAFLASHLDARQIRITKIAASPVGDGGWDVEAMILVPDLSIKSLDLELSQEVLEQESCLVQLDAAMAVRAYELLGKNN